MIRYEMFYGYPEDVEVEISDWLKLLQEKLAKKPKLVSVTQSMQTTGSDADILCVGIFYE